MNDKHYVAKCMALSKKLKSVLSGEDTNVWINVLIVTLAGIITTCTKEDKHLSATTEVIGELLKAVSQMSDTFAEEMVEVAIPFSEVEGLLEELGTNKTKH